MLESIPWSSVLDISASGLLVVVVIMILRGDLVPIRFYRSILEQKEHWREAAEKLRETNAVQAKTIEKQTIVGDTFVKVMSAVQQATDDEKRGPQ